MQLLGYVIFAFKFSKLMMALQKLVVLPDKKAQMPDTHKKPIIITLAFEKRKGFIVRSTSEVTGGKALKSVSLIQGLGQNLRGWGNRLIRGSAGQAGVRWRALNIYGKVWKGF